MCIEENEVLVAEKDITVYKVLREKDEILYFPYRSYDGNPYIAPDRKVFHIENDAVGFEDGYGYSSFLDLKIAKEYKHILEHYVTNYFNSIKTLIIPKGSKYSTGKIVIGLLGEGLLAARSEKLREVSC